MQHILLHIVTLIFYAEFEFTPFKALIPNEIDFPGKDNIGIEAYSSNAFCFNFR